MQKSDDLSSYVPCAEIERELNCCESWVDLQKFLLKHMLKGLLKAGFQVTSLAHFELEDSLAGAGLDACSIES